MIIFLRKVFFAPQLSLSGQKIRNFLGVENLENLLKEEYLSEKIGGRKISQC